MRNIGVAVHVAVKNEETFKWKLLKVIASTVPFTSKATVGELQLTPIEDANKNPVLTVKALRNGMAPLPPLATTAPLIEETVSCNVDTIPVAIPAVPITVVVEPT